MANDSQCRYKCIYLGYREELLVIYKKNYLSLYLAEILFWHLLKHFFMMVRLRINDFPLRKNDRKIKKLNRLIAKMW